MTEKFQNKYRISSARLQNWDYGNNAACFVTICTQNREHYFGDITNGIMQLSEIGDMANKYWLEIPEHFPFVELAKFVIMPNHVHGIIIINKPNNEHSGRDKACLVSAGKTQNNWATTFPKSGKRIFVIHNWFIQIGINKKCP